MVYGDIPVIYVITPILIITASLHSLCLLCLAPVKPPDRLSVTALASDAYAYHARIKIKKKERIKRMPHHRDVGFDQKSRWAGNADDHGVSVVNGGMIFLPS